LGVTRFAANVGFLYGELPSEARIEAAGADGFEAVESAWPANPAGFAGAVRSAGLRVALLNVAAGDLEAGERGHANDPSAVDQWRSDLLAALDLAARVGCRTLNVLAGNDVRAVPASDQWATLRSNLAWALPLASSHGRQLVVEMLNPHDTPAYLVTDPDVARELVEPLAPAGLRLQFDTYHAARIGLDVPAAFADLAPLVGHVQVADAPGRHEPGSGAIDWRAFFGALAGRRYDGAVGLEYRPARTTRGGLGWLPAEARGWSSEPFIPRTSGPGVRPSLSHPDAGQ
jgi:hydroxypyruvate isomerase